MSTVEDLRHINFHTMILEAMEREAMRYRFLRNEAREAGFFVGMDADNGNVTVTGEELDRRIDEILQPRYDSLMRMRNSYWAEEKAKEAAKQTKKRTVR
jgi:hypothetical protein